MTAAGVFRLVNGDGDRLGSLYRRDGGEVIDEMERTTDNRGEAS